MKQISYLLLLISAFFSQHAFAVVTSPESVTSSSTFHTYNEINLIDQSGLTGGLESGLHDDVFFHSWMGDADDTSPTVTFDLGGVEDITAAHIWQYGYTPDRGVNGFNILYSMDDVSYSLLGSANLTISPGGSVPAQVIPMVTTARYIRFEVTSNHGSANYTGLAEVAFDIGALTETSTEPVPGLSGWMVLFLSLLVLTIGARRYRLS